MDENLVSYIKSEIFDNEKFESSSNTYSIPGEPNLTLSVHEMVQIICFTLIFINAYV